MGAENRSHIGFFLNLDKPSDREIDHILQTIPTYISKTSYIKRAIMFYSQNCPDSNPNLFRLNGGINSGFNRAYNIFNEDEYDNFENQYRENVARNEKKVNNKAQTLKKSAVNENVSNQDEDVINSSVNTQTNERIKTISTGNELLVSDNSDVNDDVDYDEFYSI